MKSDCLSLFSVARITLGIIGVYVFCCMSAYAAPISFDDFYADPSVSISSSGATAIFEEDPDPAYDLVLLANDPGLGDPEVIIASPSTSLSFDWSFDEPVGEDDEFAFFILDGATGLSLGTAYELFVQDTMSGTFSVDLSALVGLTLGAQFQLSSLPGDAGKTSTLEIYNLQLIPSIPVPEPPTVMLMILAIFGMTSNHLRRFLPARN